ncbi:MULTISPECIES: enoyl-CoA hydratase/isomerase family protein [Bradyrhizobium]|uniref:Enoyl-CoA hydratase/isomerase family protein n=2 Tax=Bradyrhizobium TaxID=374 RepID=A0AAE5X8C5_9BRAD|nr:MULTISPECIES: enoyl-CoA hydratase/isomerase family protein [Bradyrhizobium]QOZ57013.1 enoyl-CoA hydratase/isomerase family protein [Bradyrhizobium sp. CCBAU 53338]QOZ80968.1 enoyl-CoA hydratase/isomerase family protein [Bradyrhizobium sp. CCBAU 53351]MDN4984505.1 enoyl-CoA hydratase/isomerase family protein [Bradyrhizobium sp. WYCCWR 13022]MDN5002497.1 enoyl-CoA hydratase/isomerase family protein [Bradyrhizobium sp. WYCCWR 12677]QAU43711.1 enoyl-CoA hydratase/isomerase family protein [Brady
MSGTEDLFVGRADGVVRLRLNRPEVGNALNPGLIAALTREVEEARRSCARLMIVESSGRNFCTGFDLSRLQEETDDTLLARFVRIEYCLQAIKNAPFPTLAIARGRAIGAGADLFCACAIRWILPGSSFVFPGANFGLVLGTSRLAEIVGAATAAEWIMGGATVDAQSALESGLAMKQIGYEDIERAVSSETARACRLDSSTHQSIWMAAASARSVRGETGDGFDMLRLIASASQVGLKERIASYRTASQSIWPVTSP